MSSPDRKLLKEFYRYFPDVVMECGDLVRSVDRHSPDRDILIYTPG
ncbi:MULTISPECIES: hypothetical protein [Microcoleaceae]|nr:hypothetical protein [Tychonema sp. LEGE 06208]MBE9161040.1 hypothetical protein [Tychonema sp. LEGE 06208]